MTHYCTACFSEFEDNTGPLPHANCVHCVFCGARIALRSRPRAPTSVVPFSKDYEREEAFALGVINGNGPGFPDTLREFRVRTSQRGLDSLTPLAQGSEPPAAAPPGPPAPRKFASLSASLSVGFGVGVAIAFAAVSLRPEAAPSATSAPVAAAPAAVHAPTPALPTTPAPTPVTVTAPVNAPQPLAKAAVRAVPRPAQDRAWLLDRARAEQRQYRIAAAERLYREALLRSPQDSEALSGLGELELLRGTVDLAEARFQEALSANANYIPALIAAADIRWQAGRTEEARRAYLEIVDHYSADSYPPYVVLRSSAATNAACAP